MEKLTQFVTEHINDDTTRLLLNRGKWADIDMDMAVNCIESRKKLKGKVQEWCDEPGLVFPRRLSAEQCSSSVTGRFKAGVAEGISRLASLARNDRDEGARNDGDEGARNEGFRLADLTGGLGVDSWFFSQKASEVLYCEMLPELCEAARHNFAVLSAENITVLNAAVCGGGTSPLASLGRSDNETSIFQSPEEILAEFKPDIVYMDPARRGEGGKKVFLIEDCTPDVLTLKDEIFKHTRNIFLKLSPMADITMVCDRLGRTCREVYVVAAGGECKELLVWMDREWDDDYTIHAVELDKCGEANIFSFKPAEEKSATISYWSGAKELIDETDIADTYLFEPGKALMKAGAFNLIVERFGLDKLGRSTHYYIFSGKAESPAEQLAETLKGYGKIFSILRVDSLDKRSMKAAGKDYPKAEVTARNLPMDTDTLRKKLGVTSGDDAHIFGLKSDSQGALLIICK